MADLLPPNATTLERNLATVMGALGELATPLRDLINPATCPERLLPWLAWAVSVDSWDDTWPEERRRAVIAASYQVHRVKGTLASLKAALAALGVDALVTEWWQEQPKAAPFTFRVDVETAGDGMTMAFLRAIEAQVDAVKPVRCHFTTRLVSTTAPKVFVGVACHSAIISTIYPKVP